MITKYVMARIYRYHKDVFIVTEATIKIGKGKALYVVVGPTVRVWGTIYKKV